MPKKVMRRKIGAGLGTMAKFLIPGYGAIQALRGKGRGKRKQVGKGLGSVLGDIGRGLGGGVGGGINSLFSSLFGGARKRRAGRPKRRQLGKGVLSDLNELAKETKIISKGLEKFGVNPFGIKGVAETLGYGKKKRRAPRKHRGGYMPAVYHEMMGSGLSNLHL